MSDSNRVQISILKQSEKGTVQATDPFLEVFHTGGSFGAPMDTGRSNKVRSDAQRGAAVRLGLNPQAAINMELQAKVFDALMAGFFRSTWSTPTEISNTDIQANNTGSQFTSTAVNFTTEDVDVGQWVYVAGFDTSGANGWFKVTSIAAGELGVTPAPEDDANAGGNTITMEGSYIRNGVQDQYYALQCQHLDLTNKIRFIQDARIGQMQLSANSRAIVTGSFNFEGLSFALNAALEGDGTVTAADETETLNATDHVSDIYIDGAAYDGCVTNFSFSGNANSRRKNCVGSLLSSDIGLGAFDFSGNFSIYLSDSAWAGLMTDYLAFTKMGIAFPFTDAAGNGYVFELLQIALTSEPGNIPGPDGDCMLEFSFEAEPVTIGAETKTAQICRRQVTA